MSRTPVRVSAKRRVARNRRIAAAICGVLILLPVAHSAATTTHAQADPTRAYVVQPGDTLWSIASRAGKPGADPRILVETISAANHLDAGSLVPGQMIRIPID